MKKRVISALLVMAMCLSLGATALASDSPTNGETEAPASGDGSSANEAIVAETGKVNVGALTDKEQTGWKTAFKGTEATEKEVTEYVTKKNENALNEKKVVKAGSVDVSVPEIPAGKTVWVRFQVDGVKASNEVIVYHLTKAGDWEALKAVAADGAIIAEFSSFSPVMYVVTEKAEAEKPTETEKPTEAEKPTETEKPTEAQKPAETTQAPTNNNDSTKSPNTGVSSNAVLVVLFVMALGGAAWYGKKCFGNAR